MSEVKNVKVIAIDEKLINDMIGILTEIPYGKVGGIMKSIESGGIRVMEVPENSLNIPTNTAKMAEMPMEPVMKPVKTDKKAE